MPRCKQCLSKTKPNEDRCSICGIDPQKIAVNLLPPEKKTRWHALGIRFLSAAHLLVALSILLAIPAIGHAPALLILSAINLILSIGLARFALRAYQGATTYYFLIGMVNVISIQHGTIYLGGIAAALLALYLVGNKTSKAIFERRLPGE